MERKIKLEEYKLLKCMLKDLKTHQFEIEDLKLVDEKAKKIIEEFNNTITSLENLDKENLNDKFLFGEDQGRYIISVSDGLASEVTKILDDKGIFFQKIGKTGGKKLIINDHEEAAIETLKKIHENWFNNYLEE